MSLSICTCGSGRFVGGCVCVCVPVPLLLCVFVQLSTCVFALKFEHLKNGHASQRRQRVTPTKTTSANNNVPLALSCPALSPSLIAAPLRRRRLSTKILIAATLCVRVAQC